MAAKLGVEEVGRRETCSLWEIFRGSVDWPLLYLGVEEMAKSAREGRLGLDMDTWERELRSCLRHWVTSLCIAKEESRTTQLASSEEVDELNYMMWKEATLVVPLVWLNLSADYFWFQKKKKRKKRNPETILINFTFKKKCWPFHFHNETKVEVKVLKQALFRT